METGVLLVQADVTEMRVEQDLRDHLETTGALERWVHQAFKDPPGWLELPETQGNAALRDVMDRLDR